MGRVKRNSTLTDLQQRFVNEYVIDSNGTQAAIRAGYSADTADVAASRLLGNVKVSEAIQKKQKKIEEKLELSAEWVLKRLKENVERAMTAQPVLDREGNETGEYRYDGSVANKALELLGKHLKLWNEKEDKQEGNVQVAVLILPDNRVTENVQANRIQSTARTTDRLPDDDS